LRMRALRRLCAAAAVLLAPACAYVEAPTGGPVDSIAPRLVATRPDTAAVLAGWTGPAVFVFDEGLSEQGVDQAVTLSPRRGPVAVDKEGDEIRVRPRRGWEPGLIYQIEVAPGLRDRFNNVIPTISRLVFSTGPAIPDTRAAGAVTDRIRGEPSAQARVDAMRLADSLTYSTLADSAGRYAFAQVPEGEYRVIGYRDTNRNLRVDAYEQRDTVLVTLVAGEAPVADLALVPNDTTPPVAGSARMTEGWVEVRFDDFLDPDQEVALTQVTLTGPDSAVVTLAEVRVGPPPAAPDTAGAAADSTPAIQPGRLARPGRPAAADTAGADTAGADTMPPPPPLPSQSLFARPAAPLVPDTIYTVRVEGVRNVNGLVGGGEAPLRTPEPPPPPPPADSIAKPPADSAAGADSAAVPPDSVVADSVTVDSVGVDSAGTGPVRADPVAVDPVVADSAGVDSAGAGPARTDTAAVDSLAADSAAPPAPPPALRRAPETPRAPPGSVPEGRADERPSAVPGARNSGARDRIARREGAAVRADPAGSSSPVAGSMQFEAV